MKAWYLNLKPPPILDIQLLVKANRESGSKPGIGGMLSLSYQVVSGFNETLWQPVSKHFGPNHPNSVEPSGISEFPISPDTDGQDSVRLSPPLKTRVAIRLKSDFRNTQAAGKRR